MHIFICSLQKHIISICSTVGIIVAIYASGNDFAFCFLGAQVIDTLPFNTHNDVKGQSVAWNFINLMGMSFDDPSGDSKKTILRREKAQKNAGTTRPAGTTPRAVSLLLKRSSRRTSASLNARARSRRTEPAIRAEISRSPSPRQRSADGQTFR